MDCGFLNLPSAVPVFDDTTPKQRGSIHVHNGRRATGGTGAPEQSQQHASGDQRGAVHPNSYIDDGGNIT